MSRWFRFYDEALDDPKVQSLPPETFKAWVNLLCLAARNDGRIPDSETCSFALRTDIGSVDQLLDRLRIGGLIDLRKGGSNGSYIAIHGWEKRQYKSDTSSERVKRFRKRSSNVPGNAPETDIPIVKTIGAGARKILFEEGLSSLMRQTGATEDRARQLIGKWLKLTRDDAAKILTKINQSEADSRADPVAWIEAALRAQESIPIQRRRGFGFG